jgi:serine/threonine protein kinase
MLFSSQRDDEEREQSSQMMTMMIASDSSAPHSLTSSPVRKKRNKAGTSLLFSDSQEVSLIDTMNAHHHRREERDHSNATTLASGSCPPSMLFPTDGEILGIGHPDDISLPPSQQFYHQQLHFGDTSSNANSYDFLSSSISSFRGNNRHLMLGLSQEEYNSQSQSSFSISQFSQDFADRLSSMQMKCASSLSNTQEDSQAVMSQCHSQQNDSSSFPFPYASQSSDLSMIGGVRLENAFSGLPSTAKKGSGLQSKTSSSVAISSQRKNSKGTPSPGRMTAGGEGGRRSRSNSSLLLLRGEKEENFCPNSQTIPRSTIKAINTANQHNRKDLRSKGSKGSHHQQQQSQQLMIEPEKQIDLPSVNQNPFLSYDASSPLEYYYHQYLSSSTSASAVSVPMSSKKRSSSSSSAFVPRKLWIGAYKERPRYYTDYEEVMQLGEGTFSSVTAVRNVIDGCLYAIKKCNEKISSSSHQALLLKEVHALSYLSSASSSSETTAACPNLIRYYNSWIHDSHLYIQLELCSLGSLEDLIVMNPSKTSIMRALLASSSSLPFLPNPSFSSSSSSSSSAASSSSFGLYRSDSFPLPLPSEGCFLGSQNTNPPQQQSSSHIEGLVMKGIQEDCGWRILKEISKALVFMHGRSLVHLDIRPANIFLTLSSTSSSSSPSTASTVSTSMSSSTSALSASKTTGSSSVHALERGNSFRSLPPSSHHKPPSSAASSLFSAVINGSSFTLSSSSSLNEPFSRSSSLNGQPAAAAASSLISKTEAYLSARKKVENSLVTGAYKIRLGDLGHTRHAIKDKERDIEEGQTRYCPRELIDFSLSKVDLMKCDVFSLGASLYELCLGRFLGEGGGGGSGSGGGVDEWHNIRDGILDEASLSKKENPYSKEWKELLRRMMFPLPAERPTAKELLEKTEKYFERKRNQETFAAVSDSISYPVMELAGSQQPMVTSDVSSSESADLQEEVQRLKALLMKNNISF